MKTIRELISMHKRLICESVGSKIKISLVLPYHHYVNLKFVKYDWYNLEYMLLCINAMIERVSSSVIDELKK